MDDSVNGVVYCSWCQVEPAWFKKPKPVCFDCDMCRGNRRDPAGCQYPLAAVRAEQKLVREDDKGSPFYLLKVNREGVERGMRWWRGELPGWVLEETKLRVERNEIMGYSEDTIDCFLYSINPAWKTEPLPVREAMLEINISNLRKQVKACQGVIATQDTEIDELESEVESLNDQLESVEDKLAVSEKALRVEKAYNGTAETVLSDVRRALGTADGHCVVQRAHTVMTINHELGTIAVNFRNDEPRLPIRDFALRAEIADLRTRNDKQAEVIRNMDYRLSRHTGESPRRTFEDYLSGGKHGK